MHFDFTGTCKHCHKEMHFMLSLDSEDFQFDLAYEIRCFECGHKISSNDVERFVHLAETIINANEQNNISCVNKIVIRQR